MAHGVSQHSGTNKGQRTGRAPWLVSTGKWSQCFPNEQRLGRLTKLERLTEFIALHIVNAAAAAAAKSLQSCPTLCDPIDGSPPGSPIPGILQARTLEWVAISFSNAWKWQVKVKSLSCVRLLATPWTAAYRLLRPWDFPSKSTRVGCHCLLQHIVNTQ